MYFLTLRWVELKNNALGLNNIKIESVSCTVTFSASSPVCSMVLVAEYEIEHVLVSVQ